MVIFNFLQKNGHFIYLLARDYYNILTDNKHNRTFVTQEKRNKLYKGRKKNI